MTNMPDLDDDRFDAELNANPVKAMMQCQADYSQNSVGHRENRWKLIQRATLVSRKLRKSERDMQAFLDDGFWTDRAYKMKSDRIIRYCMQVLVGAPSPKSAKYNTACDYAKAANFLLERGHKPKHIFAQLKKCGGTYRVLKEDKKGDQAGSQTGGDEEPQPPQEPGMDSAGCPAPTSPDNTGASGSAAETPPGTEAKKNPRVFNAQKHIAVTGNQYQADMLNVAPHERRWVLLKWTEDDGNVRRIEVSDMKREDEVRVR